MKRKLFIFVLIAALIISVFGVSGSAVVNNAYPAIFGTPSFNIELISSSDTVAPGEKFTVSVYAVDISTAEGLLSLDVPFAFDETKVEFFSKELIYPAEWGRYGDDFSWEAAKDGFIWVRSVCTGGDFQTGAKDDRSICFNLTFRVLPTAENGTAVFEALNTSRDLSIAGAEAKTANNLFGNGASLSVTVSDGTEPSTSVDESSGDTQSSEDTESSGDTSEIPERKKGDVNNDGDVDAMDASSVLQHDAGLIKLDGDSLAVADVNGDGDVDAMDASRILQLDAGLISAFA